MKMNLYPKLAWHGIVKNKKTYLPFLLTSIGIFMMYYIVSYLTYSKSVHEMHGGQNLQLILSWGMAVTAIFAVIFLFYMNSFLMRRRKTEFGLYNILGMGKWNIARILLWQNLMLFVTSLAGGLGLGVLLSKLAELCAARVLDNEAVLAFSIEPTAVRNTLLLTLICFALILLYSLGQIHVAKPVELLRGEKVGEKPPKARWLLAVIGVILLGIAYYLAATIEEPMAALSVFFVAIVLVIIASYLLFICGSVALCKILQKNKRYYYKTSHFVSVSSMAYRMKRNGASLASICILSTAVLVMISSSLCLYIGEEDILYSRYPTDMEVNSYSADAEYTTSIENAVSEVMHTYDVTPEHEIHYSYLPVAGMQQENKIIIDRKNFDGFVNYDDVLQVMIYTLEQYNQLSDQTETLSDNHVLIHMEKGEFPYDMLQFGEMAPMYVEKQVDLFASQGINLVSSFSTMYLVVQDADTLQEIYDYQKQVYGDDASEMETYYGFDLDCDEETQIAILDDMDSNIQALQLQDASFPRVDTACRAEQRHNCYSLYGGLLFLGIMLSIVFLFGTVLIMYYKQISEGYEDASRFEIMQKVGMTQKEIRKSINSQVLTVFAAPLLAAGVHTGFAFPLVRRILMMFGLTNTPLLVGVTVGSFLVFAILYVIMYKLTSRSYYQLVK